MNNICEWKPSHIFPSHYEVSEGGDVRNRVGKVLKPALDKDGYLYYVLCVNGDRRTVKAHRLVALTFIDNPENKPAIDHINGNKKDNRVENLRWVTNKENSNNPLTLSKLQRNAKKHIPVLIQKSIERDFGRIKTKVYKDGKLAGVFNSQKLAAEYTKVSPGQVSQCVSGKKVSCKGYVFKEV